MLNRRFAAFQFRPVWKVLGFAIAYCMALLLMMILLVVITKAPVTSLELEFLLEVFVEAAIALAITFIFLKMENLPIRSVGLRLNRKWIFELTKGISGGIVMICLIAFLLFSIHGVSWKINPSVSLGRIGSGFVLFLIAAFHEELVFRGYMFQRLAGMIGPKSALLIMSIAFMLIHLPNSGISSASLISKTIALTNIFLCGFLLGLAFLRTGSLALPIGIHLGWNWSQGNLLGFAVSGIDVAKCPWKPALHAPDWLSGGDIGLEGSVFCCLVCVISIAILAVWKKQARIAPN